MSQRQKARDMLSANGHGAELRHVTTRIAPKTPAAPMFPNQAVEGAQTSPQNGLAADPNAQPQGFCRGGRA